MSFQLLKVELVLKNLVSNLQAWLYNLSGNTGYVEGIFHLKPRDGHDVHPQFIFRRGIFI